MEQLLFEQTARGAVLKKYTGHAAHVTVPAQAHGKPVVEIADYAFANHEQLQRVSLPACVEDIGNHVFYNCHALEQLHLAHGLRSVGDGAFKNCRNLHAISVNGLTWLKSLVTDFTNEITLTIHERGETIILLLSLIHICLLSYYRVFLLILLYAVWNNFSRVICLVPELRDSLRVS